MKYFHGAGRSGPYFEGWYLKHQAPDGQVLAAIPALHIDSAGRASASIQIITDGQTWTLDYPGQAFQASEGIFQVWLGGSLFNRKGFWPDLHGSGLDLSGSLRYGPFTPLKSDIMGPFRHVPGMQCSHGVLSMGHRLEGSLVLGGRAIDFTGGTGYLETDRGSSFPSAYLWTQCAWREDRCNSLMLSIADIPFLGGHFLGCICAVLYGGKEYRLATYRGARVERWSRDGALIRQGSNRLHVEFLEGGAHPLLAPDRGSMTRTIHESPSATVRFRFWTGDRLLFDHTDRGAGFEYAAPTEEPMRPGV